MAEPLRIRPLRASDVNTGLVRAVSALLSELNPDLPRMTGRALAQIIRQRQTTLYAAFLSGRIVGMLTVAVHHLPSRTAMVIEDVVVDPKVRGQGIGRRLIEAAIERARKRGVDTIDLTSRPPRTAASAMYQSLGFERRGTNVYRYDARTRGGGK